MPDGPWNMKGAPLKLTFQGCLRSMTAWWATRDLTTSCRVQFQDKAGGVSRATKSGFGNGIRVWGVLAEP